MLLPRIVLPWPPRSLSPNGRAHWRAKNAAKQRQARDADALAREAGLHFAAIPDGATVWLTLTACPTPRGPYPDDDNLIASLKGARDALAAVLRVDDTRFRVRPVERGQRCPNGGVIVEMEVTE